MKKLLLILSVAAFAACNSNAKSTESTIDSSANAVSDSLISKGDSLPVKADSSDKVMADTLKK